MASSILSDNGVSSGSAGLKSTADSTGVLALQTTTSGGTATTALTIDTSQNATFAGSVKTNTLTSAASTALTLQSAGTTAITVDTSQRVGIGTVSPSYKGDIYTYTASTLVDLLRLNNAGGSNGGGAGLRFEDAGASARIAGVVFGPNENSGLGLGFYTSTGTTGAVNEAARIDSSARLLVGLTSPNTSGSNFQVSSGVTFPATQSASSDANTLDDYEEGTFTPVLVPGAGSLTTQTCSGKYTKVGRVVTIYVIAHINVVGTASGTMTVTGLPFTPADRANIAIVREDNNTGFAYMFVTNTSATTGVYYTLTTNTNPPWIAGNIFPFTLTYQV
jgi:hypothetical protein